MKKAYDSIVVISCACVLGIVILVNLFFNRLPSSVTSVDLSSDGLISLSPLTEEVIDNLSVDTTLYWIVEGGNENTQIEYLLNRYVEKSEFISVEKIDPILYPDFAAHFTDSDLNNNSILVKQGDKGRYLDYYDLFTVNYGTYGDGVTDTVFNGENLITSSISTLMNNYSNVVYILRGHNEVDLPESITSVLTRESYELKDLNLLTQKSIPVDADVIILVSPEKDLTSNESLLLHDYLANGGNLIALTPYSSDSMPNVEEIMSLYGLEKVHGIVFEKDSDRYYDTYQMYLIPEICRHVISESLINGYYNLITPLCEGLILNNESIHDCEVTALLMSSESSYAKTEGYDIKTIDKEDHDVDGPFILSAAILDKTTGGRIVWFASSRMFDEDVDSVVSGANSELIVNSIDWITDRELSLNIRPKYLTSGKLTISSENKIKYSIVLLAVIPGIIAAIGIIIFYKRKKR